MNDYIWKLDVEYPESALHPEGVHFYGGSLKSDWAPRGWTPDDEYIIRFGTERFVWPVVRRFYLSRSSAVDRAFCWSTTDVESGYYVREQSNSRNATSSARSALFEEMQHESPIAPQGWPMD